jgi:hypothetical protein
VNPYPGLRPFDDNEADVTVFFGRDSQVDELLARLQRNRFVGIVGQSGCGKSSLVRAGLLPALHAGFIAGAGSHWLIATMRPGSRPIESLARALERSGALDRISDDQPLRVGLTRAVLDSGALGLLEALRQARLDPDENVLIVVDQFEELFRYKHAASAAHVADEAAAFVKLLLEAAGAADVPIYVVITMRSDFIGECAAFRGLPERLNDSLFLVPRLTRDQLREAIEGPAGIEGVTIAPRLVNRLLNEVGDDPDQLPVLQHALMRTWDTWEARGARNEPIDIADYEKTGGLANALSRHGDEIYAALPSEKHREIAARVFRALTEDAGEGRGIRRPMAFGVLAAVAAATPAETATVIDAFRAINVSFLSPLGSEPLQDQTIVDLSHEAVMRNWACLSYAEQWWSSDKPNEAWAERYGDPGGLAAVTAFITQSRAVTDREIEREREMAQAKSEARVARRTRNLAIVAAVIALFAIGALAVAAVFGTQASQARAALAMQQQKAEVDALRAGQERTKHEMTQQRAFDKQIQKKDIKLQAALKDAARQKSIADAARAVAQAEAKKLSAQENSSRLAQFGSALYDNDQIDLRIAGLVAVDSYTLSQTNQAASSLLYYEHTSGALGRVATPPWNLAAVTGAGADAVVLAGKQQTAYLEPVTGTLAVIGVDNLGVRARLSNVTGTLMCGFDRAASVAIATSTSINFYAIAGVPHETWSLPVDGVEALACFPYGGSVVAYVDRSHTLRSDGPRGRKTIGSVDAPARGLVLSNSTMYVAVITDDGTITLFSFQKGKIATLPHALSDLTKDCSGADGCSGAVAFTPSDDGVFFYDKGNVHHVDLSLSHDATFPCDPSLCAHPRLVNADDPKHPLVIANGSIAFGDSKYEQRYSSRDATPHAVIDMRRQMWFAAYDPDVANRPNPLGGGLATHSFHAIEAPMLGWASDSQWARSYLLSGDEVLTPASPSGYIVRNLDTFRAPPNAYSLSYRVRVFDSADGRHGAAFNYITGELDALDLRTNKPLRTIHTASVPLDKNRLYLYNVDAAYDPSTGILTRFAHWSRNTPLKYADLQRFDSTGRMIEHLTLAQLEASGGFTTSSVLEWHLSSRGNYIIVSRGKNTDYLLRADGSVAGMANWIRDLTPDEGIAFALADSEGGSLTMFRLPQWTPLALTPIPSTAVHFTRAPNGRLIAYDDNGTLKLYDTTAHLSYAYDLPTPYDIKLAADKKTPFGDLGLSFSADSRYLLMSYITTANEYHLAAYSVDPSAWMRSICLMAGLPLSASEYAPIGGSVPYRNGCAPYASVMYY